MRPAASLLRITAATVITGLGGLLGCSAQPCIQPPCLPQEALTLQVRDAVDGGPVSDPVANGRSCGSSGTCIPTAPDGGQLGAGHVAVDVTAPGYGHAGLEVDISAAPMDGCACQFGFVPQTRDVLLPPL